MKNTIIGFVSLAVFVGGVFWIATSKQQSSPTQTSVAPALEQVAINAKAPEASFTTIDGKQMKLSSFKGKKVMFWLVATWCSSCIEGAKVLAQNESKLGNLTVITLKTYGNAGYPGPSIKDFAQAVPAMLLAKNWQWGDLTQQSTRTYNSRNYPDIYFLIDKEGIVREVNDAPAATIADILKFAQN